MSDQPRPPAVTTAYLFGGASALLLLVNLSGAVLNWNASTTVEEDVHRRPPPSPTDKGE